MHIPRDQLVSYQNTKNEDLIQGSKCFFLLQIFNKSGSDLDLLREKIFSLGLKLVKFPLVSLRKNMLMIVPVATYLPIKNSNYAVVGWKALNHTELQALAIILQEEEATFLFGHQENMWFDTKRLLKNEEQPFLPSQNIFQVFALLNRLAFSTFSFPYNLQPLLMQLDLLYYQPK